jgi:phosphopantothenoylcysteine decarboxylase/phosphopantothenate--cysteine ligase
MLRGKKIILGVTGGIAAYKSAYLVRLLVKSGAEVQVVMTPNAKEFITPVTMSALSGKPVISEFFTSNTGQWNSHVDLGLWADAMVIAPATASTIGKMANGIADNMLVTTYLSAKAPVFIAPAMDLDMLKHPTTKRNIELLKSYGNHIIEPTNGELASHLTGKGRMEEPENIVKVLDEYFECEDGEVCGNGVYSDGESRINRAESNGEICGKELKGRKILITAGPTYEKIDPVRYIGNFSSGKMGFAIAEECLERGGDVTLVAGPVSRECSKEIERIDVTSAQEMCDAVTGKFDKCDIAIMCAAVADYGVENYSDVKIKREKDEIPVIKLKRNKDIAKAIGEKKRKGQITVGFALETNNEEENAKAKLESKNLDMIVLNSLRDKNAAFQADTNKVTIIERNGEVKKYGCKDKRLVAKDIIDVIIKDYLI